MNRKHRILAGLIAVALIAPAPRAFAETITWGSATTMSADSDVSTSGALDRAYLRGNSTSINGVSFTDIGSNVLGDSTGGGMTIPYGGFYPNSGPLFLNYNNLTPAYQVLAKYGVYSANGNGTLTLSSLNIGLDYTIQLWVSDSREFGGNPIAGRMETIGGSPSLDFNLQNGTGGVGQFVTGAFTAAGASTTLTVNANASPNASAQLNAMQLRATGVSSGTAIITAPQNWSALSIASGAVLRYDLASDSRQSTILSGQGAVEKTGAGTLTLSGANTYTGTTVVNGGTLRLQGVPILPTGLRIMPLGDSITYGSGGSNAGYRGPLYNLLSPVAHNFAYVGTATQNPGSLPAGPIDETHDEGHPSYTIQDVSDNLDGFNNATYLQYGDPSRDPNGGYWFPGGNGANGTPNRAAIYPDVITLMIGTNDLSNQTGVQSRLHGLISKIVTERPNAKLLVARIVPSTARPNVDSYNTIVVSEVSSFQSAGKQVSLVDLNMNFPAGGLGGDGVHPNDTGYAFMTNQWYDAIVAACVQSYGPSNSIPAGSPLELGVGATLDLDGAQATVGPLSGGGRVTLGVGGVLTTGSLAGQDSTFSGTISGSGGLIKTGAGTLTLSGASNYSGPMQLSGGILNVIGSISNNGAVDVASGTVLNLAGGALSASSIHIAVGGTLMGAGAVNGEITNDGIISAGAGQSLSFTGKITNNGLIKFTGGAALHVSGTVANYGTVDLLTASTGLPANLVNYGSGVSYDSTDLKLSTISVAGGKAVMTIQSFSGHTYQLQTSGSLDPSSWQNTGASEAGATGSVLSFNDSPATTDYQRFYRVLVTP